MPNDYGRQVQRCFKVLMQGRAGVEKMERVIGKLTLELKKND